MNRYFKSLYWSLLCFLMFAGTARAEITAAELRSLLSRASVSASAHRPTNACTPQFVSVSEGTAPLLTLEGRVLQSLLHAQGELKALSAEQRLSYVFEGYRNAVPILLQVIRETRIHLQNRNIMIDYITGFRRRIIDRQEEIQFRHISMAEALNLLEAQVQTDFRVGWFDAYVEQIILFEDQARQATQRDRDLNSRQILAEAVSRTRQFVREGFLPYPSEDHFGVNSFAVTWALGIYPMGISSTPEIMFDGNPQPVRRYGYRRHDLLAHFVFTLNYLRLPDSSPWKRWIGNLLYRTSLIADDTSLFEQSFMLYFYMHEKDLLLHMLRTPFNIESADDWSGLVRMAVEGYAGNTVDTIIERSLRDHDQLEGLPTHWRQLIEQNRLDELRDQLTLAHDQFSQRLRDSFPFSIRN